MKAIQLALLFAAGVLVCWSAGAEKKIYLHDQFNADVVTAAAQIGGAPTFVSPGFAMGEAFGQIYTPKSWEYPVKFTGVDLYFAAPPNGMVQGTTAVIELWYLEGDGAVPDKEKPDFSISTSDVFDLGVGGEGVKLVGGAGIQLEFDWDDPGGHPPLMFAGKVMLLIRFSAPGQSLETQWNQTACVKELVVGFCGCQPVGTISDASITSGANVMHILAGGCSGEASKWMFAENLGIKGDFVLRLVADVGSCNPLCGGKSCGPDGCDGSCGSCLDGQSCVDGKCTGGGCTAQCDGKQCGDDGCDGFCGQCGPNQTCQQGACVCVPNCAGKTCGNDGCNGSCGDCNANEVCSQGQCAEARGCTPDCDGKQCGDDGCGGVCGVCTAAETCVKDQCSGKTTDVPGKLTVSGISPAAGFEDEQTEVSILGGGFVDGTEARLGGTLLHAIDVVGDTLMTATVPKAMTPGIYTLIVTNADGTSAHLNEAFEVKVAAPSQRGGGGGCVISGKSGNYGAPAWFVLLLCLAVIQSRRRGESAGRGHESGVPAPAR